MASITASRGLYVWQSLVFGGVGYLRSRSVWLRAFPDESCCDQLALKAAPCTAVSTTAQCWHGWSLQKGCTRVLTRSQGF